MHILSQQGVVNSQSQKYVLILFVSNLKKGILCNYVIALSSEFNQVSGTAMMSVLKSVVKSLKAKVLFLTDLAFNKQKLTSDPDAG